MRRRTAIRWIRNGSLAMVVANILAWAMSEFGWCIVSTPFASLAIYNGGLTITNITTSDSFDQKSPVWSQWDGFRGLHFGQFTCAWGDEFFGNSQPWLIIGIPFWGTSLLAFGIWLLCKLQLRRLNRLPGMCPTCGYDASRCTMGRCSECGEPLPAPTQVDAPA